MNDTSPSTFSRIKPAGSFFFKILSTSKNKVPRVSVKPNLFPAAEKDWHGKPAQQMSKSGISFSLTCVISPFFNLVRMILF